MEQNSGQIRCLYPPLGKGEKRSGSGPVDFCNKEVPNEPTDMPLVQLCVPSACTVHVCVCVLCLFACTHKWSKAVYE